LKPASMINEGQTLLQLEAPRPLEGIVPV